MRARAIALVGMMLLGACAENEEEPIEDDGLCDQGRGGCIDGAVYACMGTIVAGWLPCANGMCDPGGGPFCAPPPPDPMCPAESPPLEFLEVGYCEGDFLRVCEARQLADTIVCGSGLCREAANQLYAACVASAAPDPVCDGPGIFGRCDGNLLFACVDGYRSAAMRDCTTTGSVCLQTADDASCEPM